MPAQLPAWVQALVAILTPYGGWGLFGIAFLDSSFLTFPILNDLFVFWLSVRRPERMLFYATMTALGSVLGCLVIYLLAKRAGEAMLRRRARPEQVERIVRWYERYRFLTLAVPAVLPPPAPFKVFIIAAGVLQVSWRHFLTAVVLGRGARYYLVGFLAVHYGEQGITFISENFLQVSLLAAALVAMGFLILRLASRARVAGSHRSSH